MANAERMEFVEGGGTVFPADDSGGLLVGAVEPEPANWDDAAAFLLPPYPQGALEVSGNLATGASSASVGCSLGGEHVRFEQNRSLPHTLPPCTDFPRDECSVKDEEGASFFQERDLLDWHAGNFCAGRRDSRFQLTGPKYFVPDVIYAPSDVDPHEVLNVPDSCPSQERLGTDLNTPTESELRLHTWNVAGASAKMVKTLVSQELDAEVVARQEYPKQAAGWQLVKGETYHGLIHQNYFMYRAVAIFYRVGVFHLLGRTASERGMWLHLKHIETSKEIGVGCLHLPNNQPREENQRLLQQFMREKPRPGSAGVVLGDFNTQFKWSVVENMCVPSIIDTRWADLRQVMSEHGFQQTPPPPCQATTPTFHSRKANTTSTQIDGCFVAGLACTMTIKVDSRVRVGTDHDGVELRGFFKGKRQRERRVRGGGPMRVVASPPPSDRR